jgi:hypothetical protein
MHVSFFQASLMFEEDKTPQGAPLWEGCGFYHKIRLNSKKFQL